MTSRLHVAMSVTLIFVAIFALIMGSRAMFTWGRPHVAARSHMTGLAEGELFQIASLSLVDSFLDHHSDSCAITHCILSALRSPLTTCGNKLRWASMVPWGLVHDYILPMAQAPPVHSPPVAIVTLTPTQKTQMVARFTELMREYHNEELRKKTPLYTTH